MSQYPAPPLLRLREADIVRLCGLASASEGLRLADRHLIQDCRRHAGRLAATTDVEGSARESWVEVSEAGAGLAFAWKCWCATDGPARDADGRVLTTPACSHVAAILTTWLRDPAAFIEEPGEAAATQPPAAPTMGGARKHHGMAAVAPPAGRMHLAAGAPSRTLHNALASLAISRQEALATVVLGGAVASLAGETLTERLAEALADPACVAHILEELDPPAAALLWAVRLRGGSVTSGEMDGLGERHRGGPVAVTTARHRLQACGLLFRAGAPVAGADHENQTQGTVHSRESEAVVWYVPVEIAHAIELVEHTETEMPVRPMPFNAANGPPRFDAAENGTPTVSRTWVRNALVRQLVLAAALLAPLVADATPGDRVRLSRASHSPRHVHGAPAEPLPPQPGDPPAATLANWAESTHLPAGLLRLAWRLDHTGHSAARSAHSLATLTRLPVAEWAAALRDAFRHWLESESYGELADLTLMEHRVHARCDPHHEALRRGGLGAENAAARRYAAEVVAQFSVGMWYDLDDLLDVMWWVHPWFLRARQRVFSNPAWWLAGAESERPLRAWVREEWRRAEGQYIAYLFTGPLHWWGVLDVAGAHETNETTARAVRLTTLGAYLLGRLRAAPESVHALGTGWGPAALPIHEMMGGVGVAVQPCAAPPALLDALGTWARVIGPAGDRLLWRFSTDLVARALDAGIDPETLLAPLRAVDERDHTRGAHDIAQLMAAWRARYGASRVEMGQALLEAVDAPTLREALAHAPDIAARCRQISPTCALVPADLAEALAHTLDRRGFVV